MQKKLSLMAGTVLSVTLFLFFHAVLAVGTICWIVILIPAMLFRWSLDDRNEAPVRSVSNRRNRA
jgi:hypothetical protein